MAKRRAELEEQEQEEDAEVEWQKAAWVSGSIWGLGVGMVHEVMGEEVGESRREIILKDEDERIVIDREGSGDVAQNGNDVEMREAKPEMDEEMDEGEID